MGGSSGSLFFLLIMAALLVFMFSRTRKQQKNQQQMQSTVEPGAQVMTTSGMFGTVVERTDEHVAIEIAPGLVTRWTPRAVARVVAAAPAVEQVPDSLEGLDLTKRDRAVDQDTPGDDAAGGAARS